MINHRITATRLAEALNAIKPSPAREDTLRAFQEVFPELYIFVQAGGLVVVADR